MTTDEILHNLNPEQTLSVTTIDGYVRVIAGPGTGKTKVLISRLIYIVKVNGIDPKKILCVTFTNKAANEMRERVTALLGYRLDSTISTFHGFCYKFLLGHVHLLNYPNNFMIIDGSEQLKIIREIYAENNISSHAFPLAEMIAYISGLKNRIEYIPSSTMLGLPLDLNNPKNKVFACYLQKQKESMCLDFDDLLLFTLHILRHHADLLEYWQNRFQYIQVDEFQDVNQAQYDLIFLLQGKHKNLFVVGDPDQTIYSWRGSNISFINDFETQFPGTQTFLLKTNYRSNSSILEVCNALIKNNSNRIDKPLIPEIIGKNKVIHYGARNIYDEAHFIADSIETLKTDHHAEFSDIAVLYRSSYISRQLEESFIQSRIPYTVVKGTAFYERLEIKDVLAFLKVLVYGDDISLLRIINKPSRKMGTMRIEFLKKYARDNKVTLLQALNACVGQPPLKFPEIIQFVAILNTVKSRIGELSTSKAIDEILNKTGYEKALRYDLDSDRIENVMELKQSVTRQEETAGGTLEIAEYLAGVALYAEMTDETHPNSVKLMTIHSCKGLEFPYIIVCGLNEDKFPSSRISSETEMEEERRLAYVAFSRAKRGLILTSANGLDYKNIPLRPSRFLSEITLGLIREIKPANLHIPKS
ncbi:MAG: UvrD-helicase domain-containing protein [Lentisphaerota bacterium]